MNRRNKEIEKLVKQSHIEVGTDDIDYNS